ncbi:unnamed protein product [Adineta steineri]|uniref:Uncharacterized protein n=1 Tax=Adineta steineri TaxID=433720 RepID=A0A813RN07_9BILA|nr:unnamed protein product [Adineta steineri]
MSRFKSYINPTLIKDSKNGSNISIHSTATPTRRHVTQITIGADDDNDKPPIPPTRHPMVNRLTSSIDESLVNLTFLGQDADVEQERALYELEQVFSQVRKHIDKCFRQYEHEIKSSYVNYDQHLHDLKLRLKQVRQELIQNFTSVHHNDNDNDNDYSFDIDKYRYLEMLTTQTLNQTMKDQKKLPKYRIKLNNIDRLDQFFNIDSDQKSSRTISETDNVDNDDSSRDITSIERSLSVVTSTSTDITDEYDNVPKDDYGEYRVSYHNALKAPLINLEKWSCPLGFGNYFIPLSTPYRQSSLLLYCLDRESFICYDSQSLLSLPTVIKWRGTRPSAVYWFDEMNMLFVACRTHIYGCYLDEKVPDSQRINIRIPVEQTSTWSDTQGHVCWPNFLTCGGGIDRLLYAYWTDVVNKNATPSTSFIYYQIQGNSFLIKSQFLIDGRLRALHSTLSTGRLGLLIEHITNQCTHLEIRTSKEFSLLAKFELRTAYEQFRYGCCLTNLMFNSNSYVLCDHKQQQLWHVNGDTGDIKVKHMNESIYSISCLLDGTLAMLTGTPMRFDFIYDPNDTGIILKDLFHEEESIEV